MTAPIPNHSHTLSSATGNGPMRRGFTLIELLTVIAIIGILAAILIPTVAKVRQSANDNRTKALFSQLITAIETYRQEYGYYPNFDLRNADQNVFRLGDATIDHAFITTLSGRDIGGARIEQSGHPNPRGIQFYSFSESDLEYRSGNQPPRVVDAYGNSEIVIIIDRSQRGVIRPADVADGAGRMMVSSVRSPEIQVAPEIPEQGIRQGVLIYSAGTGGNSAAVARDNLVKSWE